MELIKTICWSQHFNFIIVVKNLWYLSAAIRDSSITAVWPVWEPKATGLASELKGAAGSGSAEVIWLKSKTYSETPWIINSVSYDLTIMFSSQLLDASTCWQPSLCDFCQRDQRVESCELWCWKRMDLWEERFVCLSLAVENWECFLMNAILFFKNQLERDFFFFYK